MVTCGHTFCSSCIALMKKATTLQCVMCLKLIKNIETIDYLPVNHSIMKILSKDDESLLEFRQNKKVLTDKNVNLRTV